MTDDVMPASELYTDSFAADPYPALARLRAERPVCPVGSPRFDSWLITRFDDARTALTDPRLSKDLYGPDQHYLKIFGPNSEGLNRNMLNSDPPEHTRLRRVVSQAFAPRRIEALRPRVASIVDQLIDIDPRLKLFFPSKAFDPLAVMMNRRSMNCAPNFRVDIRTEIERHDSLDVIPQLSITLKDGDHALNIMLHRAGRADIRKLAYIFVEIFLDGGCDHPFPSLKGIIEGTFGDTRAMTDLIHAEGCNALLGDELPRLSQDSLTPFDNGRA